MTSAGKVIRAVRRWNADSFVTPIDALILINVLNEQSLSSDSPP